MFLHADLVCNVLPQGRFGLQERPAPGRTNGGVYTAPVTSSGVIATLPRQFQQQSIQSLYKAGWIFQAPALCQACLIQQ